MRKWILRWMVGLERSFYLQCIFGSIRKCQRKRSQFRPEFLLGPHNIFHTKDTKTDRIIITMTPTLSYCQNDDTEIGEHKISGTGPSNAAADESAKTTDNCTLKRDGLAAIFAALSFVVGFSLFSTVLVDLSDDDLTSLEELQVIKENEKVYYLSNMILYVCFGFAQLVLSVGMADSSKKVFPATASVTKSLGIVWSTLVLAAGMIGNVGAKEALDLLQTDEDAVAAGYLWKVIRTIHSGMGGGNEIVGGMWVLLAAWSDFKGRASPNNNTKVTKLDIITFGVANIAGWSGICSTVPIMADSCAIVFGVGMILWYVLIGITMFSRSSFEINTVA